MRVTRVSTTPIKGLALHHPQSIDITLTGAVGDREFYLVDDKDTLVSIARTGSLVGMSAQWVDPELIVTHPEGQTRAAVELGTEHTAMFFGHHEVRGRVVEGPWAELFSAYAGRPLRLVRASEPNGGRDIDPLSLLGTASLDRLAREAGASVDGRRFRMLIEFDGGRPHEEDEWLGRRVRIGATVVEGGGPVQRCAGTTRHPDSGESDLQTLRHIGAYRGRQDSIFGLGFNFGVYAHPIVPGTISIGDELELLDDVAGPQGA